MLFVVVLLFWLFSHNFFSLLFFLQELPGENFGVHVSFISHRREEMQLTGDLDQFDEMIMQQMAGFVQNYGLDQKGNDVLGERAQLVVARA